MYNRVPAVIRSFSWFSDPRTPALSNGARAPGGRGPHAMAPKQRKSAKTGGGAPLAQAAAATLPPPAAASPDSCNGQLLVDVQAAIAEITGHDAFVGMEQLPPTTTGSRPPFASAACDED